MARPIKDTPMLKGEDARRFVELMNTPRPESKEQRARRQASYKTVLSMFVK